MPITFTKVAGGRAYASPILGPRDHLAALDIDLAGLTDDEVDANGFLKPGVPFTKAGTLVGSGEFVYGVSIEPIKVAAGNTEDDLDGVVRVGVLVIGVVVLDIAVAQLERAYTAAEIAGFDLAGSKLVLHHDISINT